MLLFRWGGGLHTYILPRVMGGGLQRDYPTNKGDGEAQWK